MIANAVTQQAWVNHDCIGNLAKHRNIAAPKLKAQTVKHFFVTTVLKQG